MKAGEVLESAAYDRRLTLREAPDGAHTICS